jgi:hypothetical protein
MNIENIQARHSFDVQYIGNFLGIEAYDTWMEAHFMDSLCARGPHNEHAQYEIFNLTDSL